VTSIRQSWAGYLQKELIPHGLIAQPINLQAKNQAGSAIARGTVEVTASEVRQFVSYGLIGVFLLVSFKLTYQMFCLCGSTECGTDGNLNDKNV
jgi:hypothetical protein